MPFGPDNRLTGETVGSAAHRSTRKGRNMTTPQPIPTTENLSPFLQIHASVWPGSLDAAKVDDHGLFVMVDPPKVGSQCHGAALGLTFHGRAVDVAAELRRLADRIHPAPVLDEPTPCVHWLDVDAHRTECGIDATMHPYGEGLTAADVTRNELRVTCPDCLTAIRS